MGFDVLDRTIYKVVHGSHAYGTNIASSDRDEKGVCIEPMSYMIGYLNRFEQNEQLASNGHSCDRVIYSLRKFAKLAADCNPNIIEALFVDDTDVLYCDQFGRKLREFAPNFLSKKAKHTFSGYAHAQLKKIKTHRSWLLDPPKEAPTRTQFNLPETGKISKAELGAFDAAISQGHDVNMSSEMLDVFLREKQYVAAKMRWNQYQNWKTTRNPSRAESEANFGYDVKHANHLIRLMRMCKEILSFGEVIVRRPDAKDLLAIRAGEWSYDDVLEHAQQLDAECAVLYETSTVLPKEPNRKKIDEFVIELTLEFLKNRKEL